MAALISVLVFTALIHVPASSQPQLPPHPVASRWTFNWTDGLYPRYAPCAHAGSRRPPLTPGPRTH